MSISRNSVGPLLLVGIVMTVAAVLQSSGRTALASDAQSASASNTGLTVHGDPPDPVDVSPELKKIYQHIDANFDPYVADLQKWVRMQSISNQIEGQPGIWQSAQFIRDFITQKLGCKADIHAPGMGDWGAPGNPIVYGRCDVGAKKTIIDYIQSDAMPAWPEDNWETPPFAGTIVPKPPFKRVIMGRATNNHKGRELAQLNALASIKAVTGTLPVNVIFVADHDEERMEIGLRKFVNDHPDWFKGADAFFGYAGHQLPDGRGEIEGQSIGCVVFQLETSGARPGKGLGQQPMWRHMKMLATMYGDGADGNEVLIKGLSDDVQPVSAEETAYIRREAEITGGNFEQMMAERTRVRVNMTGIWGGNMAPGFAGSITPSLITSKHDIRFPPNVDGEDVLRKVRAHLDAHGYKDAKMTVTGVVPWNWANAESDIARATIQMFKQFGVPYAEPPKGNYMGPRATYYGPTYLFSRGPIRVPIVRAGLGHGFGAHYGPEGYVIEGDGKKIYGFAGAMKAYATVLYNYAGLNAPQSSLEK